MNRYASAGIVKDAQSGKRVVVAVHSRTEGRALLHDIEAQRPEGLNLVYRGNGAERIDFTNGGGIRLLCTAAGDSARGLTADAIFVEGWNDLPASVREDFVAAASAGAELIRA